jgi:transcriptional regulator with XRE-family HTH domain
VSNNEDMVYSSGDSSEFDGDDESRAYAKALGQRLRAVRKQKHLSLQAVEQISQEEFKASVLGAYERGERAISVPRLQRLAKIYDVPVDQLLPRDGSITMAIPQGLSGGQAVSEFNEQLRVTVDLTKLSQVNGPERDLLRHFLSMIQLQRQDFNGKMITIRSDDLKIIASLFGMTPVAMCQRLEELGLRIPTPSQ